MTLSERLRSVAKTFSQKKRGEERKQLKGFWRGSTMGMCGRLQAYDFLGFREESTFESDKDWSLEDGHLHEGDIIERLNLVEGVKVISSNQPVKRIFKTAKGTVVKIAGTPDVHIDDNGTQAIIEIKALFDSTFQEVKRKNEPPQKYITQLKVYMWALNVKQGVLFIKNRNNSETISFEYELSKEDALKLMKRQVLLQRYIDEEKMPPREYQLGSQECFYCPHNKRCHGDKPFKGYIHKKEGEREITVDLSDTPKAQQEFIIAVKTYEEAKKKGEVYSQVESDAKEKLNKLMRKFKATGLSGNGYSAKLIQSSGHDIPDPVVLKQFISAGDIPMIKSKGSEYIRVNVPKATVIKELIPTKLSTKGKR